MKGVKAHIQVLEVVIPRYFKHRPLIYTLQEWVVREIYLQQAAGTIVPMTHSEWAALIVPIVKINGSIWICRKPQVYDNICGRLCTQGYPVEFPLDQ